MDKNNKISVATKLVAMKKGVKTFFGDGVKYDNCQTANLIELYVDW